MARRLTLRIDAELIERARRHGQVHGKSISRLVADYFAALEDVDRVEEAEYPPMTRSLHGALRGADISREDYRVALERKYLG